MQPSAKWKGIETKVHGLNSRTGASDINDPDFTAFPPFSELNNGQQMGENTNMFWLYDTGTFPLNSLIDDWTICYTAVDNHELSLNNIGVFTTDIDNPTYITDNYDTNGIMFYNSNGYKRIVSNIPTVPYGTPQLRDYYRFACPPYNNSKCVWTPNADGARSSQGYLVFYPQCNEQGYAAPYKTFGIKSLFLEIRVKPYQIGNIPLPVQDYSLKAYRALTDAEKNSNPICYAYARVHRRGNVDGTYTALGGGYDINAAITVPFSGNGYSDIGAYFNNVYYKNDGDLLFLPLFGNMSGARSAGVVRYQKQENKADVFYGYDKIDHRQLVSDSSLERIYSFTMAGNDENLEYLRKSCAAYGLFFCEDTIHGNTNFEDSSTENTRWTDENMFLGIIEEDGYTRGRYTHGAENANQAQFNWTNSTDSNFDPAVRPDSDPNRYETSTPLPGLRGIAANYWSDKGYLGANAGMNIQNAVNDITSMADPNYADETSALNAIANQLRLKEFGFQEPFDTVLDYRRIFLTQPHTALTPVAPILLGRYYTDSLTNPFAGYTDMPEFRRETLGSFSFWRTFKNFLDFEPYTQASLYVPFCGMKEIPMNIFMGHTVNIYLNACNSTGELEVLIFVDNMEWGTMLGTAAEELPLQAPQAMSVAVQKHNLNYQIEEVKRSKLTGILGSVAGATISAAMGNPLGVMAQAASAYTKGVQAKAQIAELRYQIDHTKPEITAIQKGSPVIESINVLTPFILLQTPVINGGEYDDVKKKYGKTKGFKCCVSGSLGDFSGLTVCSTANLDGISCTYTEKQMILEALQEGVILDWE